MVYILINLTTRLLIGFRSFDPSNYSPVWCKIRYFSVSTLSAIVLTCSCLVTIDQYLFSSRNPRIRRFSNIKWAHRMAFIFIMIWFLHGIPVLVYYEISSITNTCTYNNPIHYQYILICTLVVLCFIPVATMVLFAYLTYRNIRQTLALREQQADRQLVRMTFIQVFLVLISIFPYGLCSLYLSITTNVTKDSDRSLKEALSATVTLMLSYVYYAVC